MFVHFFTDWQADIVLDNSIKMHWKQEFSNEEVFLWSTIPPNNLLNEIAYRIINLIRYNQKSTNTFYFVSKYHNNNKNYTLFFIGNNTLVFPNIGLHFLFQEYFNHKFETYINKQDILFFEDNLEFVKSTHKALKSDAWKSLFAITSNLSYPSQNFFTETKIFEGPDKTMLTKVIYIHENGNIVLGIKETVFMEFTNNFKHQFVIQNLISDIEITRISKDYFDHPNDFYIAYFNELKLLEISMRSDNLAKLLSIHYHTNATFEIKLLSL
ncbi:MAG: SAM-dependent chlorinase/fluorinase [Chitinophagales bacterium]|jgi:hypothetical protein|nr:SAM-dependent chlorinase/fluorinase [Chitinophagales bacterium]